MNELFGYSGRLLRVDLGHEKITDEKLDKEIARNFVGGTGFGAWYLYKEVPAGIKWSDSENRLIFANGPLASTTVGGSGHISVVTKGPLTNGAASAQAGGFFGAFLKRSGYDGIILQGKAKRWSYLYISDDKIELKDASHLTGKDNWDTHRLIKEKQTMTRRMSIASIGPAGENLVKFAHIFVDEAHIASTNGVGAVMGSKKLKSIVVASGDKPPQLKNKEELNSIASQLHDQAESRLIPVGKNGNLVYATSSLMVPYLIPGDGRAPVKNLTTNIPKLTKERREKYDPIYLHNHFETKRNPCWACRIPHCYTYTINDGPFKGLVVEEPEYESLASFGPCIGVDEVTATMYLANEADRLGIDCNSTAWVMALAIECFEKKLITLQDIGFIELTWGNYESVAKMMQLIAHRQGFGDILAEGSMEAAQRIGKGAPNLAVHTLKGNTPRSVDARVNWPALFDTCVSQMGRIEGRSMRHPSDIGLTISRPSFIGQNTSPVDTLTWNVQCKGAEQFDDCLSVCRFNTLTDLKTVARAVSAATGWDFSAKEAMNVGRRVVNLLRVFNLRHGHTSVMDAPSTRYGSTPEDGPAKGKSIMTYWEELRRDYYQGMGWDNESGKPLPETLKKIGLEFCIDELW
jgi:aldehyde:ferredoxin oxidoreductase